MKKFLLCVCLFVISHASYGKTVDVGTAQTVAYNFLKPKINLQGLSDLSLVYTATSVVNNTTVSDYYIFNASSAKGFVIVSADDIVMPVLGYSTQSGFAVKTINPSFQYLLTNYKNQMGFAIQNNTSKPYDNVVAKWAAYESGSRAESAARTTTTTVGPLLRTLWDQENPNDSVILMYNPDCPYDSGATYRGMTITGCVATAMSQVMKYWSWPDTGVGTNTYMQSPNPDLIPAQTANFAIPYYFDSMPDTMVNVRNARVARLMYNAGVSVDMNYGTDAEGGSGAYVVIGDAPSGLPNTAQSALNTNWRYPQATGYRRRHISETLWLDSMFNEMNSSRPVIYAGQGSAGGHCFVMDGYDNDSFFHFNWGWSGDCDGYYTVNDLAPADAYGSAGDTFNDDQEAIIRIIPDTPAGYSADTATKPKVTAVTQVPLLNDNITIYPNPAANSINVSFAGIAVKEIMITDMEGRTLQETDNASGTTTAALSVSELPDGMYLLRLETDQGVLTRKFVVAK